MRTAILKLALGAVVIGPLLAGAASAGDYNGGLKGMRGSHVPVPAPEPIPEYRAGWYLRADVGAGFGTSMSTSERGMTYGAGDTAGGYVAPGGPFGIGGNAFTSFANDEGDNIAHIFGAGVGYYISPNFRIDFTGDIRAEKQSITTGHFEYDDTGTPLRVLGDVTEKVKYRSNIFMANAYYDLKRISSFQPYIGAGLGFSVNQISRTHTTNFATCNPAIPTSNCVDPPPVDSHNGRTGKQYSYSLAANLTAGVTYRLSDRTALDFNYRYLYVGGSDSSMAIGGYNSVVDIDDQHEHYIRAGLRWDIR